MKQKILFFLILLCMTQGLLFNPTVGEIDKPSLKLNYVPHDPILIDGDVQLNQTVLNEGWSGSGTENDPYIIDDLYISETVLVDGVPISLTLKNINQHTVIRDNLLKSTTKYYGYGIHLFGCSNITIMNNDIEFYAMALYVLNSDDVTIMRNTIFDNTRGCYTGDSEAVIFEENTFTNSSRYSFYIAQTEEVIFQSNTIKFSATDPSSPAWNALEQITSLILFNNTFTEIYTYGLLLNIISDAQIISNTFVECANWDIAAYSVTSSNITRNQFIKTDATSYSGNIFFNDLSTTNIIYENNFEVVSPNGEHVLTHSIGNLFYNNGRGNYYSKYSGVDDNGDGIGDTSYTIQPDVIDDYPLIKPVDLLRPVLTSHDSELTFERDDDVVISWVATDDNPTDYKVYEEHSLVKSDKWINGTNEADLGNLSIGIHVFTIKLLDIDSNYASFNVTVFVQDTSDPTSPSNSTDPLGDLGALLSDNIVPIAAVSGVGIVSILTLRRAFGGKKKPKTRKPKKKKK